MSGALADSEVIFTDRRYGKNFVRLLHVKREGKRHTVRELEVSTNLTLNDTRDFVFGDNSQIIATDSQKNTVYILAKQNGIKTIEEFGLQLADHFLRKYNHVTDARVHIKESPWTRVKQGDQEHNHAFLACADSIRFCEVEQKRHCNAKVSAGIQDMKVLKTTQSAFKNFIQDEVRSLPDADDRIFCTVVYAKWDYEHLRGLDYDRAWSAVKHAILDVFSGPPDVGVYSPSVQKTLYDTQRLALAQVPQMKSIQMELPNVHAYQFDFSKYPSFNIKKNDEVFMPTDKPSGNIRATLERKHSAKL